MSETTPAATRREADSVAISPAARAVVALLSAVVLVGVVPLAIGLVGGIAAADIAGLPFYVTFLLVPTNLGIVGAVLAVRRPGNRIGWLLLAAGALAALAFGGGEYERFAQSAGHLDWPLVVPAAWIAASWFVPGIGILVVFLPLLYPTGHHLSPGWRIVTAVGIVGVAAGALGSATAPGPLSDVDGPLNPFVPPEPLVGWIQAISAMSNLVAPPVFLLALASLLIRFRRSRGVERQQIKWFLFVTIIATVAFAISVPNIGPISDAAWAVGLLTMSFLPLAIGLAILRYGLYEIDRILSRTVGYALVTATLAAVFWAAVLVLQAALAPVTGSSTITVAGSTLVVAALFQPVRRRIQRAVDGRFNRRRYDAEREVHAFVAHAREEVEIERLADALAATLVRTVEPASASVWLRSGPTRS